MTLLALAAAFVLGVYLADRFDVPEPAVGLFLFASLLLLLTLVRLRRSPLPALLLVVLLLAMVRVEAFGGDRTSALAAYHSLHPLQLQYSSKASLSATPRRLGRPSGFGCGWWG